MLLLLQVSALSKQPAARRSAAWIPNAPGSFATISTKTSEQTEYGSKQDTASCSSLHDAARLDADSTVCVWP